MRPYKSYNHNRNKALIMLKINIKNNFAKFVALLGLASLIALSIISPLSAQTLNQGYKSDQTLEQGMLVKENDADHSKVEAVSKKTISKLKGVVVAKNDSPVVLSSSDQNVFVADNGVHQVLVSDENGPIKKGDYLSVSSLDGIAMKADSSEPVVLGQATSDFNGGGDNIGTTTLQANNKKVDLGRVQANISIVSNPLQRKIQIQSVPSILKDVSNNVAGRSVSNGRIWLATMVFLVTSLVTGIMLYGGAKNSLLALGRNPLSKASILRGLLQVVILGMIVFICGMFGVYLLLKI